VIGEILGNRYRLLCELGAGGMAWVYLADDLLEHTQVAVKVLYPQFNRDISYVQRFIREAKLALDLSNEHVVRILDYGADRDVHYLVMESIEGQNLATVLQERGPLTWKEALSIAAQVALALDAANTRGIVHRDITPENILITEQGIVKVLDFGIARARALPTLTQTGFVGSPYYISPEQAMGKGVDIRSDIYSLGISLYEMLTGRLPFESGTPWSIISQHIAQEPPPIELTDARLPAAVGRLVNKMLAKDPNDRFQTPGELLAAVESALRGRIAPGAVTPPAKAATQPGRHSKAHQLLVASLYERGLEASEGERWSQAVNLFTQILRVDPGYRDTAERLAQAGMQARLAALYDAATQAIESERWQEALDEFNEILSVDAHYRDAASLAQKAQESLLRAQAQERLNNLYEQGIDHCRHKQWQEADACLKQVYDTDPAYRDVARLYPRIRRKAWWSRSAFGRLGHKLSKLLHNSQDIDAAAHEHILAPPVENADEGDRHERDASVQA